MEKKLTGYPSIDKPWETDYSYFERHPIIPNVNIYTLLKFLCVGKMDRIAIECNDLSVCYRRMLKDAKTVSRALLALSVKRGDIVSVCMPNLYQAVVIFLASNRIGAATTFINPWLSVDGVKSYVEKYKSPVLFNYGKTAEVNQSYMECSSIKHVVTLRTEMVDVLDLDCESAAISIPGFVDFNSLGVIAKKCRGDRHLSFNGSDTGLILYTSGTTGAPKSVVLTNRNIVAAGIISKNDTKVKHLTGDRTLVCVPFTYPYGFYTSTLTTLLTGKTAILAPDMSGDTIASYLLKKPNIIFGSPALIELIMRNTPDEQDLSSILHIMSGGDFLTPALASQAKEYFVRHGARTIEIGNASGNAETCSCGTHSLGKKVKPDTAGRLLVGTEAMIVDPETMEQKKYNEEGMLCVSGKHVFKEYYGEPKLTAEVKFMYEGKEYFKTGTIGSIDEEGYFTITGRFSRFYIRSSLDKVYLDHVQGVISRFEPVFECAAVKVPDKEQLFVNYAFVVLKDGWSEDEETKKKIMDRCHHAVTLVDGRQDQLKDYEIPQRIIFVKDLPRRSGTDKINYQELERMAENISSK
ncbi:MAG: acyl--CoA ligase [Clostridia bacterium]|nr:acyl--CoA ligase [Clostridia bacterium]